MRVREDLLYFIWKFRQYDQVGLSTVTGEPVQVFSPGQQNESSGPDFDHAKIRIGDLLWSGNVEIHCRSSDWYLHGHEDDSWYDRIILHVVFVHDRDVPRRDGSYIPTLELQPVVDTGLLERYERLRENLATIPCERSIMNAGHFHLRSFLSRLTIEALQARATRILRLVDEFKGGWEDVFYLLLASGFGFKTNALPFEMLARNLSRTTIAKHLGNDQQIYSMLYGVSGFLDSEPLEEYPRLLRREFTYLEKKYGLIRVDRFLWKFGRLRPQNFPTVRIAQFGAVITARPDLLSTVLESKELVDLRILFSVGTVPGYWNKHYHFDKIAPEYSPQIGGGSVDNLISNTVAPFLFAYGWYRKEHDMAQRAVQLLEALPTEDNRIIRYYGSIGLRSGSMAEAKALMHLKKNYCDAKKCLNCGIGIRLLKRE